jgi:hypothetical protein
MNYETRRYGILALTLYLLSQYVHVFCTELCFQTQLICVFPLDVQSDSKLLSGFAWPIYGNPNSNSESSCIILGVQFETYPIRWHCIYASLNERDTFWHVEFSVPFCERRYP